MGRKMERKESESVKGEVEREEGRRGESESVKGEGEREERRRGGRVRRQKGE